MHVETVVVGEFQVNCYIAWADPKRAFVVDPGADAGLIREVLSAHGLSVEGYVLTHGHMDHISALADLCGTGAANVFLHPADEKWAFTGVNDWPPFYAVPVRPGAKILTSGDAAGREIGGLRWQVLETPGHTPGSVCYYLPEEKMLFSGDTLFAGSVGRTDFPGGDGRALQGSLRRLAALPDDVAVYAGHGPETTIGHEKRTNYFMQ